MIERLGISHWFDVVLILFGLVFVVALGCALLYGIVSLIAECREDD